MDAIAEFRTASEANDLDRFVDTLAPNAELVSPLLARDDYGNSSDVIAIGEWLGADSDTHQNVDAAGYGHVCL